MCVRRRWWLACWGVGCEEHTEQAPSLNPARCLPSLQSQGSHLTWVCLSFPLCKRELHVVPTPEGCGLQKFGCVRPSELCPTLGHASMVVTSPGSHPGFSGRSLTRHFSPFPFCTIILLFLFRTQAFPSHTELCSGPSSSQSPSHSSQFNSDLTLSPRPPKAPVHADPPPPALLDVCLPQRFSAALRGMLCDIIHGGLLHTRPSGRRRGRAPYMERMQLTQRCVRHLWSPLELPGRLTQ